MTDNILLEIQNFINDPDKLTLEIEFKYFRSSIYEGIRVVNELSSNKPSLKIFLVKSQLLGRISFFFRDSPKYTFSLTLNDIYLNKNEILNEINEIKIERFIALETEPIGGNQLIITSNSISVYARINGQNKTLNQYYLFPVSIKNYDSILDFSLLTTPTKATENPRPEPIQKNIEFDSRIIGIGLLILLYFIYYLFNLDTTSPQDSDIKETQINTEEVDANQVDTTKAIDPYDFSNELKENSLSYIVNTDKSYFYSQPNFSYKKRAYLVYGESITALDSQNGFIYINFENSKGTKTSGWILKSDLK
ncbi:MAG: hypothetical protein RL542_1649 [Bacteroidota bacterium]|jgi:hypothetical protein